MDTINALLAEVEFMIFLQAGPGSITSTMVKVSEEWHKHLQNERTAQMQRERSPLRMIMAMSMFKELELRSAKVIASTAEAATLRKELISQQILTEDGKAWNQLQWSPEKGRLLPSNAPTLELHKAHGVLQEIQRLVQIPGLLLRFHALKALHKFHATDGMAVIPWKMVVGHRLKESHLLYQAMQEISHSGVTQLILMRARPAGLKRSPLAQRISQALD